MLSGLSPRDMIHTSATQQHAVVLEVSVRPWYPRALRCATHTVSTMVPNPSPVPGHTSRVSAAGACRLENTQHLNQTTLCAVAIAAVRSTQWPIVAKLVMPAATGAAWHRQLSRCCCPNCNRCQRDRLHYTDATLQRFMQLISLCS
jgi:hypothetical protein